MKVKVHGTQKTYGQGIKEGKDLQRKAMIDAWHAKGNCCVCGHKLSEHIDEGDGWRCHSLDGTLFQCECFLRKNRYESILDYEITRRDTEMENSFDLLGTPWSRREDKNE